MRLYGPALAVWLAFSAFDTVAFVFRPTTTTGGGQSLSMATFHVLSSNQKSSRPHSRNAKQQLHPSSRKSTATSPDMSSSTSLGSSPDGSIYPEGGTNPCIIRVIGVGGGGGNAVDRMLDVGMNNIDFWSINTDSQALGRSKVKGAKILTIGNKGLGAGGLAEVGKMAADEARNEIASIVSEADLCFVTAGMGGGTGSGAAPVVAEVAREAGCLTIGIVTTPFSFEGKKRMETAKGAIAEMKKNVDAIIVISNTKLLELIPEETPMSDAFLIADDILREGVAGISDIITNPGTINIDFADVKSVLDNAGTALMGVGVASGKHAASKAAKRAIECPLLDSKTIENATGILMNISGGNNMSLQEVQEASDEVKGIMAPNANVIVGTSQDESFGDSVSITVVATGFKIDGESTSDVPPPPSSSSTNNDKKKKNNAGKNNKQGRDRLTELRSPSSPSLSRPSSPQQTESEEIPDKDERGDFPNFLRSLKRKR